MQGQPVILALEDSYDRIVWLRNEVRGKARVVWARGVHSFRTLYTALQDRLVLIVLDHDLGLTRVFPAPFTSMYGSSYFRIEDGPRGLDGQDAASWLAMQAPVQCPAIIWSLNFDGAKAMASELRSGAVDNAQIPFILTDQLRQAIRRVLT